MIRREFLKVASTALGTVGLAPRMLELLLGLLGLRVLRRRVLRGRLILSHALSLPARPVLHQCASRR